MAASIITEKDLRSFAMDLPETNTLIDKVRWSSEQIEQASINAVDYFNSKPPPTSAAYSVETFPYRYLLLMGTWAILLKGAAIGEASNNLEYSAAGVQINDRNKAEIFLTLGNMYWKEFTEGVEGIKLTQSLNKVYGPIYSEYRWRSF